MKVLLVSNTEGALIRFRTPIIKHLISAGVEVHTLAPKGEYYDKLESLGVIQHSMKLNRHSISLIGLYKEFKSIYCTIHRLRPDIIHSYTHKPAIMASFCAGLMRIKGIFITITGLGTLYSRDGLYYKVGRRILELCYRGISKFVTKCYFQNPDDLNHFLEKKIFTSNEVVLTGGSGVDLKEFYLLSAEEYLGLRNGLSSQIHIDLHGKIVVIFTGRGIAEKGVYEFYKAACTVGKLVPGKFVFLHVGLIDIGSREFISTQDVFDMGSQYGVHYLGFKENIIDYVGASDVVVLPSVYREGTPRSLIEALALGKVVITTDMPGCRETVIDGWNGMLCKNKDVNSLVSCILRVDSSFIVEAKNRSRSLCEVKYDVNEIAQLTYREYLDVLGR